MIQASFNDQSELNCSLVQWIKETPGIKKEELNSKEGKKKWNDTN